MKFTFYWKLRGGLSVKVSILSMSESTMHEPKGKTAIIRIKDGGYELSEISHRYEKELIMSFYDIEPRQGLPLNWNYFNRTDGEKLVQFFNELDNFDELVIHCHAGISRSPAVAISYAWFSRNNELLEDIKNGKYIPNMQVLNIMSRMIFEDRKIARVKYAEISSYYGGLINE